MRTLASGIFGVALIALGLGLGGCVDESPWGGASSESGSISLELTTDEGVYALKPLVRSGETRATTGTEQLSNYITVPTADDFTITLVNPNGTTTGGLKLSDFNTKTFPVGVYTLTATYGDKETHGFDKPYFEGSTTFTVLADRTREIVVNAELANSMIKVSYTKAFEDYMDDYYVTVSTTGETETLKYAKDEQRPAFIDPENSTVTLHFTTWRGKTAHLEISNEKFTPLPKTLHNLTFDVKKGDNEEDETLSITFNDNAEEKTVEIDMTAALAPGPEITCIGFNADQTLDLTENTVSTLKMDVSVPAGMKSAELTIASEPANSFGWPDNKIDLCTTNEQLSNYGIVAKGFGNGRPETNVMASLDLVGLCTSSKLTTGEHTITLLVTDKNGNTRTCGLVLNNKAIALTQDSALPAESKSKANYGNNNVEITLDYSGQDPTKELTFFSQDGAGNWQKATVVGTPEEQAITTRAYATKRYKFTLQVAETALKQINVRAYRKYTSGDTSATPIGEFAIPVTMPDYNIQVDAFSYYAFLKINADESVIPIIVNNLKLNGLSIDKSIYNSTGYLIISGLTANQSYSGIQSSITAGTANWDSGKVDNFKTEAAMAIPNGDFSNSGETLSSGTLQVGGQYNVTVTSKPVYYTLHSSFLITLPTEWATVNSKTAYSNSTNKNTWYVVPSSWQDEENGNGLGYMRNVGYHNQGEKISPSGGYMNSNYYCENPPSGTQLKKAAGELFLGTYSFDGTNEYRHEGVKFNSRPTKITFDYTYNPIDGDTGYAYIELIAASGVSLGEKTFNFSKGSATETITFNYDKFGQEAAYLKICFKSSKQGDAAPINIPSGAALKEDGITGTNFRNPPEIPANKYKAVATGSVLTIDNVVAHYDTAPTVVNATRAKSTKRKGNKR